MSQYRTADPSVSVSVSGVFSGCLITIVCVAFPERPSR